MQSVALHARMAALQRSSTPAGFAAARQAHNGLCHNTLDFGRHLGRVLGCAGLGAAVGRQSAGGGRCAVLGRSSSEGDGNGQRARRAAGAVGAWAGPCTASVPLEGARGSRDSPPCAGAQDDTLLGELHTSSDHQLCPAISDSRDSAPESCAGCCGRPTLLPGTPPHRRGRQQPLHGPPNQRWRAWADRRPS
jgi:hypothetical protein